MQRLAGALLCALALSSAAAAGANRPFGLADYSKIVSLSDPQIAPDGASIVVLVARQEYAQDRIATELDQIDIATGARRALTFERDHIGSPRWSPSGDRLAFIAEDAHHQGQIWILPMRGGDPRRITNAPEGVQQFAWRPNGASIAFVTTDPAPKKTGPAAHEDLFDVGDNDLFTTEKPRPSHIWLVAADASNTRRLTSGTWSTPVAYPPSPPGAPLSWSADGTSLLYTRLPNADEGDSYLSTLYALDVATGTSRKLTANGRFENFGLFAPGGDRFAYLYPRDGDPNNVTEVVVHSASGEQIVSRALDRNVYREFWMPSGNALLLGGDDTTYASIWIQPLDGPAKRIDLGDVSVRAPFWLDADVGKAGGIAFVGSTAAHPNELYYLSAPDAAPKRLTDFNAFTDGLALATAEMLTWTNDGFAENGVLWTPPNTPPGKKLPLVLLVHGGPTSASMLTFDTFAQTIASHGYLVFEPNYRGSDHHGNAYERAIFNDAGAGPGRDVMAGLAVVRARGNVDDARIAVTGWSYGGYMTSWLIGHYHVWKTAISGAAVNDLVETYDLTDGNVEGAFSFPGFVSPWKSAAALEMYRVQSPITAFKDIRTPTLILTDMRDARVSPAESFAMYHALRDNGVPVEFKAWPIAGHNPGDPVRLRQRLSVWNDWLGRWLR